MSDTPKNFPRPLSPHLQVYRLPMTAIMSISHRITGAILTGGSLLIAAFLVAAAMGEGYYNFVMTFASSWLGIVILAGWSFALYYHLCNGVRHLVWDTVTMLDEKQAILSGWVVLLITILLTAGTWYAAFAL